MEVKSGRREKEKQSAKEEIREKRVERGSLKKGEDEK